FFIAPLSVLVDPIRALRIFGLEEGGKFSEKVLYIYRKQLEEADIIVINKCDLLDASKRQMLRGELAAQFPRAEIFEVSARSGAGLGSWFDRITGAEQTARATMEVDYELYAVREAVQSAVGGLAGCFPGLKAKLEHLEHFRPGKPQPTHRITAPM